MKKSIKEKLGYEPASREAHHTVPTNLNFKFSFILPNPRKERIIMQRDSLGRIIHSRPPEIVQI